TPPLTSRLRHAAPGTPARITRVPGLATLWSTLGRNRTAIRANKERTMTTTVDGLGAFHDLVGQQIGYTEWQTITQERVNLFADATDDHQWIHVDPERAKDGPFGGPIAHGYLTLSLAPVLLNKLLRVNNMKFGVNYGANKVRF